MRRWPRRGEIYWIALGPAIGSEIRKTRPAVVISDDSCNRYGSRLVVLPLTSNVDSLYPGEALLQVRGKPARALGDQIRSIAKSRLRSKIAMVTREELLEIERAVAITLGLTPALCRQRR